MEITIEELSNRTLDVAQAYLEEADHNKWAINRDGQYAESELLTSNGAYHISIYFSNLHDSLCFDIAPSIIVDKPYLIAAEHFLSQASRGWFSGCIHIDETGAVNFHATYNLSEAVERINAFGRYLEMKNLSETDKKDLFKAAVGCFLPTKEVFASMESELMIKIMMCEKNLRKIAVGIPVDVSEPHSRMGRRRFPHGKEPDIDEVHEMVDNAIARIDEILESGILPDDDMAFESDDLSLETHNEDAPPDDTIKYTEANINDNSCMAMDDIETILSKMDQEDDESTSYNNETDTFESDPVNPGD